VEKFSLSSSVLFCYRGHCAAVLCVQFDDQKIVSGSSDNTIKVKISLSVFPYSKSSRMFFFSLLGFSCFIMICKWQVYSALLHFSLIKSHVFVLN